MAFKVDTLRQRCSYKVPFVSRKGRRDGMKNRGSQEIHSYQGRKVSITFFSDRVEVHTHVLLGTDANTDTELSNLLSIVHQSEIS